MFASTVVGPVAYPPNLSQTAPGKEAPVERDQNGTGVAPGETSPGQASEANEGGRREPVAQSEGPRKPNGETLTEEDLRQVEQLKTTDREVRQHELAHQIAGGQYTGSASYEYEIGPDGQRYAVAGTVPIDYGPVPGDPRATIDKMQQVISAALAPADPSPKDHQVAATARQYLLTAQLELAQQQSEMNKARGAAEGTEAAPDATQATEVSTALSERSALEA